MRYLDGGMTYCYRCPACRATDTRTEPAASIRCPSCLQLDGRTVVMKRDFRAEAVGIGRGVRVSRRP